MHPYRPEKIQPSIPTPEQLRKSIGIGTVFQAKCIKCDENHNLYLDLGPIQGIIPRDEAMLTVGKTNDYEILSRVGRSVSFQVLGHDRTGNIICSRRAAQLDARDYLLSALHPGDVIPAVVRNPTQFGVFCDIGCGYTALLRIARCCVSRLENTASLFSVDQDIHTAVLDIDDSTGQILLTTRELLGTWEENARKFRPGQTVPGIVRSIMPYGAFVELTPNLSGLAENTENIHPGDPVSVFIRAILPQKHKIKLNIIELLPAPAPLPKLDYRIDGGHIDRWEYFPGSKAVTVF